jgi:cytochrome c biogenesis protein CcdA
MLYGLSQITGFTFGWILWIAQTLVILLGGLICFILLPVLNRKRNESNQTHSTENT